MVNYFNKSKNFNYVSVYVDTEFNKRGYQEFLKLEKKIALEKVEKNTMKNDKTKLLRKAKLVEKNQF